MIDDHYKIVSVESTVPPKPMGGTGWHCYVIAQGTNTIRGYKQGSLEIVKQAVEEIVTRLNERRLGRRSGTYINITSRNKKVEPKKAPTA